MLLHCSFGVCFGLCGSFLLFFLQHSINVNTEPHSYQVLKMFCLSSETVVPLRRKG